MTRWIIQRVITTLEGYAVNTKDWKMGYYPCTIAKPETLDEALANLELFHFKHEVKIIREAIDKLTKENS